MQVGTESGSGGTFGPLFKGGKFRFEFIPIPEKYARRESNCPTYWDLHGRRKGRPRLSTYLPPTKANTPVHNDPEFKTYTYGHIGRRLRDLCKGDMLVFYAGLEPRDFMNEDSKQRYIVGYFEVEKAGFAKSFAPNCSARRLDHAFTKNQHVRYRDFTQECGSKESPLFLVKGKKSGSRLLLQGEPISNKRIKTTRRNGKKIKMTRYCLSEKMSRKFGVGWGDITMAVPHWITDERYAKKVKKWLQHELK